MKGGESYVEEAEERIYKAGGLERCEKADLLTGLAIFTGLKNKEKARRLIERRRDIMIESAAYEIIKQEGFEEGYNKGLLKGKEEGLKEGLLKGKEEGFKEGILRGKEEGIREGLLKGIEIGLEVRFGAEGLTLYPIIKKIKNVDVLEAISEAIKTAKSLEEIEKLCKKFYSL